MKTNKTNIRRSTLCMASLAAAMAASSLASCSSENQVIDEPRNGTEIRFNVSTDRPSRALPYTDKDQITNFKVAAWYHGDDSKGTYFNAEDMKFDSDNKTWKYGDADKVRYWPNNGEKLDFHAWVDYANAASGNKTSKGYKLTFDNDGNATLTNDNGSDIEVLDSNNAVDLLYAAVFDQENDKSSETKTVSLTYNHAYAQVGVTAKVDNPKIHMKVKEVALVNIYSKGKFKFPESSSDAAEWETTPSDAAGKVTFSQASDAVWTLGSTKTDFNVNGNRFMVLPQTAAKSESPNVNTTPCIRLLCKVWNVADASNYDDENDLLIYGGDENKAGYKYLYVPVDFNWEMGKNYTYNLSFGNGNAGLGEDGNPTLVLMTWNVGMNDWGTPEDKEIDDEDSKEEEVNP